MTFAPSNLLAARSLLQQHLGINPNALGIVGDPDHDGGYHCGRDRVDGDDYSVRESARDRNGLTEAACALDIGAFTVRVAGKSHTLRSFNAWLVAQCKANTPDTRDVREVIYSTDGKTVRRWDRLGRRTTGDSSHLWHTHISYHRDGIKAGRDQSAVFRRYLTTIGLLATTEENDMALTSADINLLLATPMGYEGLPGLTFGNLLKNLHQQGYLGFPNWQATEQVETLQGGVDNLMTVLNTQASAIATLTDKVSGLEGSVAELHDLITSGGGNPDTAAILAGVDSRLATAVEQINANVRDTAGDLGEGGASQVRGPQG